MPNTFKFTSYGVEYEIGFEKTSYCYGGGLAIEAYCKEPGDELWEPYGSLTVNIEGVPVASGSSAFLDTNNCRDLCEFVFEKGWATPIGAGRSGYCTYPLVVFTDEFLNEICETAQ